MVRKKKDSDFASIAFRVVRKATEEKEPEIEKPTGKNPNAVALGRLGGLKSAKTRKDKISPERRKEIAQKAAKARWGK